MQFLSGTYLPWTIWSFSTFPLIGEILVSFELHRVCLWRFHVLLETKLGRNDRVISSTSLAPSGLRRTNAGV